MPRSVFVEHDAGIFVILGLMFGGMGSAFLAFMGMAVAPNHPGGIWQAAFDVWPGLIFLAIVGLGLWSVPLLLGRRLWITLGAARDRDRGRLRQGIFYGPAGLLVRMEPGNCYPIPADRFVSAHVRANTSEDGPSETCFCIETKDGTVEFFDSRINGMPRYPLFVLRATTSQGSGHRQNETIGPQGMPQRLVRSSGARHSAGRVQKPG